MGKRVGKAPRRFSPPPSPLGTLLRLNRILLDRTITSSSVSGAIGRGNGGH